MSSNITAVPELLAPAGGVESLRAAIANGADAVYLGLETLNARRSAENFTLDDLAETCAFAHLRGVRVYLTANVVILQSEFTHAVELIDRAWEAGVDAVIVQDIGLLGAIVRLLPGVRVHSSTQINAHNTLTLRALADMGVSRVTLAREVGVDEIATFVRSGHVEIESFVHGALCVCYSGQCLMSSLIGRRSANRGMCAQPCRLPYELVDARGGLLETPGAHLLSPRDLAGIAVVPGLLDAGVAALKIEGRMKSAEYVALVTGVYRAALDRAAGAPESFEVREGEYAVLGESFSRGFSAAYLVGERGNDMMSYQRPNNRGVPMGRVVATAGGRATIALDSPLDAKDTIEFWTSAGRFAQPVGTLEYAGAIHATAPAGVRADVILEGSVTTGDRVFRVRNDGLSSAARRTFTSASGESVSLAFVVRLVVGEPLEIEVTDGTGRAGMWTGALVERARTKSVTAEEVAEHISRLGGTRYRVGGWDLTLSPDVGIGFSTLHRARREALDAYERGLLAPWAGRGRVIPRVELPAPRSRPRRTHPLIVAEVDGMEAAMACLDAGADRAHVPIHALVHGASLPEGIVPLMPRIAHDHEVNASLAWCAGGRSVVAGNLGLLSEAVRLGTNVEAHWSLNAVNAFSVSQLSDLGAGFIWLSPELSGRQIAELAAYAPVPVGIAVWGRQEIMVTEHCVLMAQGECGRQCAQCERRSADVYLRDRKGYLFPVRTDPQGRSHVYNSVPLDLTSALSEVFESGVAAVRVDAQLLDPKEAARRVGLIRAASTRSLSGRELASDKSAGQTTAGHFFRGLI